MTNMKLTPRYTGVERRRKARRTINDKRVQVRWEPNNPGRRLGQGRRATDVPRLLY